MGKFLNKLEKFNPKVVAFDVFFVEPEKWCKGEGLSPEKKFAKAIEQFQASGERKVILPILLISIYLASILPIENLRRFLKNFTNSC